MHTVKQVVQQSSGSGRLFFIGSSRNRNPQKSKIRPELSSGAPPEREETRDPKEKPSKRGVDIAQKSCPPKCYPT